MINGAAVSKFVCYISASLTIAACTAQSAQSDNSLSVVNDTTGFTPNIVLGQVNPEDAQTVQQWIDESVTLLTSPEFETNLIAASELYPDVWVSRSRDAIPSRKLLDILHTRDVNVPSLWWPKTYVIITGDTATRSPDQTGFGFEASRAAGAGPFPRNQGPVTTGEIELGRLHYARYAQGNIVEKSCALNTMTHEISHTLSDRPNQYWMHILDTGEDANPPHGMYEASYFIGTVAQCTYLQSAGRIAEHEFQSCLRTFSDPTFGSRFKSKACDDFPAGKPISPEGRLAP